MKNPVVIFLISLHLIAHTDFMQVCKLPELIGHFKAHHDHNHSISFLDFLNMHYGGNDDGTSRDDWEDNQLPFKKIDFHHISQVVACLPEQTVDYVTFEKPIQYFTVLYTSHPRSGATNRQLRPPISLI